MKKAYSKEFLAELLDFLAENQRFDSVKGIPDLKQQDVVEILKEIASGYKNEMAEEVSNKNVQYTSHDLSPKAMSLISCLSPREESLLFKSFKLV